MSNKFNCQKCGACCRSIKCDKLNKDNTCSIYETRPEICKVENMYEFRKDIMKVSKEEYFLLTSQMCDILRKLF